MTSTRPVFGLLAFRYAPDGKVFAAIAPSRGGMLNGTDAVEIPCPRKIADGTGMAQEIWARAELAKQGKAFNGVHIAK